MNILCRIGEDEYNVIERNPTVGAASHCYWDELMLLKYELMLLKCELVLLKCELGNW